MHIDIQVAGLECLHLVGIELGIRRKRPACVAALRHRHDHRAVLAGGGHVNVRGGAGDARGRNAALHRHVVADRDGPAALRWRRDRGNFLIAGHRDLHVSGQCDGRVRA